MLTGYSMALFTVSTSGMKCLGCVEDTAFSHVPKKDLFCNPVQSTCSTSDLIHLARQKCLISEIRDNSKSLEARWVTGAGW